MGITLLYFVGLAKNFSFTARLAWLSVFWFWVFFFGCCFFLWGGRGRVAFLPAQQTFSKLQGVHVLVTWEVSSAATCLLGVWLTDKLQLDSGLGEDIS